MGDADTLRWYESCWKRALKLCLQWSDERIEAWIAEVESRTDVNWILHDPPMWRVATLLLPPQIRGADGLNLRGRLQAALESDRSLCEMGAAPNAQAALDQADAVLCEYGSSLATERARLSM